MNKTRQKFDNLTKTPCGKTVQIVELFLNKNKPLPTGSGLLLKFKQCRPEWVHSDGGETQVSMPGCYAAFFWVFFLVACRKMASIAMAKMTPKGYATAVL